MYLHGFPAGIDLVLAKWTKSLLKHEKLHKQLNIIIITTKPDGTGTFSLAYCPQSSEKNIVIDFSVMQCDQISNYSKFILY